MNNIICPKCGYEQAQAPDCMKCGIFFDKYAEKIKENTKDLHSGENQEAAGSASGGTSPVKSRKNPTPVDHLTRTATGLEEKTRRLRDELLQLFVRLVLTYVFFAGLFYLTKGAWFLYGETHMGSMYRTYFIEKAQLTSELLALNPLKGSFEITLLAFLSCLLIGLCSQLLTLTRNLYLTSPPVLRVIIWGFICNLFTVYLIQHYFSVPLDSRPAFWVGLIPTLTLFQASFSLTAHVFPELTSLIPGKRRIFDH